MASVTEPANTAVTLHPLEPLRPEEIRLAAALVRNRLSVEGIRFESIQLSEPDKSAYRSLAPEESLPRMARVNAFCAGDIGVWQFTVALDEQVIVDETFHEAARPMIMLEEFMAIEDVVKADPDFQAACAARGIADVSMVCVDPWSAGNFGVDGEEGKHLAHTFCWLRTQENDNLYAHPIEGLNAVVDIKRMTVLRVDDHGATPVPRENSNYEAQFQPRLRDDLRPINITQPEGVSFTLTGRRLRWHDWDVIIGFNAREGLTLHDLRHGDRSVLYRASLAEMVVPYGSPKAPHHRKNVFDIGEYGLGKLANSLSLGCDCLGVIQYLGAWIPGIDGEPEPIENAICIHEEDDGLLWKHWDFRTDRTEVRRSRKLVISSISTVGNYEYASYWYLYLDGTIEFEMKATGIINTVGCEPGAGDAFGTEVLPGVMGQIHQHTFCARLDLAVDGDRNRVLECNTQAVPSGPQNPYGNAFYVNETLLEREGGRRRNADTERYWRFASAGRRNRMGKPTAYRLEPIHSLTPFTNPESPSGERMRFIYNDLWLTRHPSKRLYPAGEFMNHSDGTEGLSAWTAEPESVVDEDIVAWHVFGIHHMPRLEDFPVQPVVKTGFVLTPDGFFDRNPTMDLPDERNRASQYAGCCQSD